MTDPIVTLPADHWIVRAFEEWCIDNSLSYTAEVWMAFAAGCQAVPGNPDELRLLEQKIEELQHDGHEVRISRIEDLIDAQTDANNKLADFIDRTRERLAKIESRLDNREKTAPPDRDKAPLVFASSIAEAAVYRRAHDPLNTSYYRVITHIDQVRGITPDPLRVVHVVEPLTQSAHEALMFWRNCCRIKG